jgi:NAD+ synthase
LLMRPDEENNHTAGALIDDITHWIRHQMTMAGAAGAVLGMSGGLDSSVAAALCKRALGNDVLGLVLPCHSDPSDRADALMVAESLDITTEMVDLGEIFDLLVSVLPAGDRVSVANVKARLRMIVLYYYANQHGWLVVGSSNKSELLTGYLTKCGDGGADLLPLGGLLKTQVRDVARALSIPNRIIDKPPSAGLWEGQTDEGEMGVTYEELDRAILALQGGECDDPDDETLDRVRQMISRSHHKRAPVPRYEPR